MTLEKSIQTCTATLTIAPAVKYRCIERGKHHTRHVFDLGYGERREFELTAKATGAVASFHVRWLEI